MERRLFFGGLNELRAIAALSVIFHHIELYSFRDHRPSLYNFPAFYTFISQLGKNGVYLFFVLSGFLITFLLLKEKQQTSDISISKFYLRRIFRIWPLYFIIMILSFVVLPVLVSYTSFFNSETYYITLLHRASLYSTGNVLLYFLLLSNFAVPVVGASQSWSVSVEEQFYLVWPNIIKRFSRERLLWFFAFLFVFLVGYESLHLPLYAYLKKIPLEIMAIGGVYAYFWHYHRERLMPYLKRNILFAAVIASVLFGLFFPVPKIVLSVCFGALILFVITERRFNLRNKLLSFLGTISYGIYMYHPLMMFFASAIANKITGNGIIYKILFYVLTVSLTIAISQLSYALIEKKLIAFKDKKYSRIT